MRSLHPADAVHNGFGISQQAFCNAKMAFVYTNALLASFVWALSLREVSTLKVRSC